MNTLTRTNAFRRDRWLKRKDLIEITPLQGVNSLIDSLWQIARVNMGERSYIKKLEYMRVGNWVVYKLLPFRCLHYPNLMLTPGNRGKEKTEFSWNFMYH